jgi:Zn-dependent M28 family amino/carboxypeptidase
MPVTASITLRNAVRRSTSNNVLGVLPGGERADEYVVYMAHWDHLGMDASLEGDQIYNGALDNATGTAGLLELARAFASLEMPPKRSLLFLAVTAEEQGLLGSAHYALNPTVPLAKTVAAINMDGLNIYGPMNDVTVIGLGNSELDDYLTDAARRQKRRVRPDPEAEKGFYFRSDHFNFAKEGVPALYTDQGIDHVEHGEAWTMERRAEYTADNYHKPSDEYDVNWDLSGRAASRRPPPSDTERPAPGLRGRPLALVRWGPWGLGVVGLHKPDVRQGAVLFVVIQAVAHHPHIGDVEAQIIDLHLYLVAVLLAHDGAGAHRGGVTSLQ